MSDISNVLRKVIELDISLGLDGTQEALDEITRLTAEVERLKAINALMEYAAFPTSEEAREAEEWIKANPGRPLSDYCSPGGLRVKQLTAEVERLRSLTVVQESLIRKSEAANEKLRAALWDIHAYCNNWDWFIWMWPMRRIKRIARAALTGDKQ